MHHTNWSASGLYISKGIIDKHDGYICVDSDGEGQGTTFTILIPLNPQAASVPIELPDTSIEANHNQPCLDAHLSNSSSSSNKHSDKTIIGKRVQLQQSKQTHQRRSSIKEVTSYGLSF